MKQKLTVTITRLRRQSMTVLKPALRVPCPFCLREVEALSRVQAACVLGIKERMLDELLAGGRIHSIQTINHHLWVCKDSLFIE